MIQEIEYADLSEELMSSVDELTNDTLPQGQSFFLEEGKVVAIENNLRPLFEAQNQDAIESGSIQEII